MTRPIENSTVKSNPSCFRWFGHFETEEEADAKSESKSKSKSKSKSESKSKSKSKAEAEADKMVATPNQLHREGMQTLGMDPLYLQARIIETTVVEPLEESHRTMKVEDKCPEEAMLQPPEEKAAGTSVSMTIPMGAIEQQQPMDAVNASYQ